MSARRRTSRIALFTLVVSTSACSDGGGPDRSDTTTTSTPGPTTTGASVAGVTPCELLTLDDFAAVDVEIDRPATDISSILQLATTSSAACQWRGDGNWDLIVGTGNAAQAFGFDRDFAEGDGATDLDVGDDAFIVDREESATPEDYDHEAGVLIGELYVWLGSTSDEGAEATAELAALLAERVAGASG